MSRKLNCPHCGTEAEAGSMLYGGGMLEQYRCPTFKLEAAWRYCGAPSICVWYRGEDGRKAANSYRKASDAWRKRAMTHADPDNPGSAAWTWNGEAPPSPPSGLIVFVGDMENMRLACA